MYFKNPSLFAQDNVFRKKNQVKKKGVKSQEDAIREEMKEGKGEGGKREEESRMGHLGMKDDAVCCCYRYFFLLFF